MESKILENIDSGIILLNDDFEIFFVNHFGAELIGLNKTELLGKSLTNFIPVTEKKVYEYIMSNETGSRFSDSCEFLAKGTSLKVNISITVFDNQGSQAHLLSIYLPRGNEKENNSNIDKEFKDFLHIVSHDLKTPMRGILALIEWLAKDYAHLFDDSGKELINLITSRVTSLSDMLEGLVTYKRTIMAKEEDASISLNELFKECIDELGDLPDLEIKVEESLPVITSKRNKVKRLITELIKNAVTFNNKEKKEINIGLKKDSQNVFYIQDNGIGIEKKLLDQVFKLFHTVKPKDDTDTLGLGLTIAKAIANIDGGDVWIDSQLGKGSTVFFKLTS